MFLRLILLGSVLIVQISEQSQGFPNEAYLSDAICSSDKRCIFVDDCPPVYNLMVRNLLPLHRFRQAICGYDNIKPKVCCDVDKNSLNPTFADEGGVFFSKPSSNAECGKSLLRSNVDVVGRYPFVARIGFIGFDGDIRYSCAGVIINERTILTTASCALAKSANYKLYNVLVGEFNTETDPDCNVLFCGHRVRAYNISYVVKHPNYRTDTFASNLALLRLDEPIQFSVTVQPICILPRDRSVAIGANSVLVGWGKRSRQRAKPSNQQSLEMKVLSPPDCSRSYERGLSIEMCAVGEEMPCSGYSGSPLIVAHGDTYFLAGILSFGANCDAGVNFPSVFVNAQRYTRWILENC